MKKAQYTLAFILCLKQCRQEDGKIYKIKTIVNASTMRVIFLLNIYKYSVTLLIQCSWVKLIKIS